MVFVYNPVKVRFGEVDMFGHVNNVVAFTYFEEARIALFKELGFMQSGHMHHQKR